MKIEAKDMNEMTRILSGEASVEERDHFYEALASNPDKKTAFELMEKEWITAGDAMIYKNLDVDAAWQRHQKEFIGLSGNEKKSSYGMILKWAAVIVIAVGLSFYFMMDRLNTGQQITSYSTGSAETLPVTLADGSIITLNQNSSLEYDFSGEIRKVNFSGEAYFEIAADAKKPFVIEMETAYIKVIGTAFNVKTNESAIDVLVKEGVVEFGPKDRSEKTLLNAGSSGRLSQNQLLNIEDVPTNSIAWYTKDLVFDQSPLTDVFTDISSAYHISFQYDNDKLKDCRLTADFSNEEIRDVLETLHTIFKVDFVKEENTYIVTGDACNVE